MNSFNFSSGLSYVTSIFNRASLRGIPARVANAFSTREKSVAAVAAVIFAATVVAVYAHIKCTFKKVADANLFAPTPTASSPAFPTSNRFIAAAIPIVFTTPIVPPTNPSKTPAAAAASAGTVDEPEPESQPVQTPLADPANVQPAESPVLNVLELPRDESMSPSAAAAPSAVVNTSTAEISGPSLSQTPASVNSQKKQVESAKKQAHLKELKKEQIREERKFLNGLFFETVSHLRMDPALKGDTGRLGKRLEKYCNAALSGLNPSRRGLGNPFIQQYQRQKYELSSLNRFTVNKWMENEIVNIKRVHEEVMESLAQKLKLS